MKKHKWFLAVLRQHSGKVICFVLLAAIGSFSSAYSRTAAGDAVDHFGQGGASYSFLYIAAAAAALYLLCAFGLGRYKRIVTNAVSVTIDDTIERRVLSLRMDTYHKITSGALTTLITKDKQLITRAMERILSRMLPDCCLWIVGVIAMGRISLWLALISVCLSVLTVLWFTVWSKALHVQQDACLREVEALNTQNAASLGTLETCKAWHDEEQEIQSSGRHIQLILRAARRIHRTESLISVPSTASAFIILLGIVFTAGFLCIRGQITTGQALAAVLLADTVCNPAMSMDNSIRAIRRGQAALDRMTAFLGESGNNSVDASELPQWDQPGIYVDHVSFAYDSDKPVLRRFSRKFVPGHPYCIRGANGSGKSTLLYLIAGVLAPQEGRISIGASKSDRYPTTAVCTQDICAFQTSIRENICGESPCDTEKLERITRALGIHDEILQTPDGYDTVLGENGEPLSRGQRQRLSICRVLYQDADILLFDEPTSALDPVHSDLFFRYIRAEAKSKTILIISHDPVELADFEEIDMEVIA